MIRNVLIPQCLNTIKERIKKSNWYRWVWMPGDHWKMFPAPSGIQTNIDDSDLVALTAGKHLVFRVQLKAGCAWRRDWANEDALQRLLSLATVSGGRTYRRDSFSKLKFFNACIKKFNGRGASTANMVFELVHAWLCVYSHFSLTYGLLSIISEEYSKHSDVRYPYCTAFPRIEEAWHEICIIKPAGEKIMRNNSGFTILELFVVIAVLVLLTAISIPGFFAYLPRHRLNSAARDLYSNLHLAKMAAIKANGTCTVTFNTGANAYAISGAMSKTILLDNYGSGVSYQAPPTFSTIASITFNSQGQISGTFGYAYLSNGANTAYYRVGSLLTGVIRMQRWGGGTTWN